MDQFMKGMHPFDRPTSSADYGRMDADHVATATPLAGDLRSRITLNRGASSGLADKTSRLSSQDRLFMQARILGKSTIVSLAAINVALFTPIEFSFGKMTALTLNAMLFCLDSFEKERKKTKAQVEGSNPKLKALKRAESLARKCGALIGFASMAILMGGVGSIAMGSAFSINNSLKVQEED